MSSPSADSRDPASGEIVSIQSQRVGQVRCIGQVLCVRLSQLSSHLSCLVCCLFFFSLFLHLFVFVFEKIWGSHCSGEGGYLYFDSEELKIEEQAWATDRTVRTFPQSPRRVQSWSSSFPSP